MNEGFSTLPVPLRLAVICLIVAMATPFIASGFAILVVLPLGLGIYVADKLVPGPYDQNRDAALFLVSWVVNSVIYCAAYLLVRHWRQQITYRAKESAPFSK